MKEEYEKLGFKVEVLTQPENGNHLYITHEDATNPDVFIIAHLDTVFPIGTVAERPFTLSEDGIAKGPGVHDMKASQVMVLYALKALIQEGHEAYKKVKILLNTDEEIGSITSRPYIEEHAKNAKAVLIAEPSGGEYLTVGRKGGGKYYLSITGKASHAGAAPEKGISAIGELGHKIVKLHELNAWEGVNVNVGVVNGGTSPNTIAPNADAKIDLRFETTEQGEKADAKIREILGYSDVEGTTLELSGGITRPAWQADDQSTALFHLVKEEAKAFGMNLNSFYSGGGSDGNFTGNMGIPTIDSLGPIGANAHQPTEFMYIDTIETRGMLFINVLKKLTHIDSIE
jgi:glutamate carboxypeptidase